MIYLLKPLCAVLPAAILMWFLYGRGKGLSISFKNVRTSFLLGIAATIIVSLIVIPFNIEKTFFGTLWKSAFPEELTKMAIMLVLLRRFRCSNLIDVLVICGSVGLGFACIENLFYILPKSNWIIVSIYRAITSVPGHFFYAFIMGYFIYKALNVANTQKTKIALLALAFAIPTIIHWLLNVNRTIVKSSTFILLDYIKTIPILIIVFIVIKKARKEAISKQQIISNDTVIE